MTVRRHARKLPNGELSRPLSAGTRPSLRRRRVCSGAHPVEPSTRWETDDLTTGTPIRREPWNKGKLVGQKAPFKLKDIWALRVRLQMEERVRELALFNLGIDSKLRGCDLVALKVREVCHGDQVASRAVVMQHKTQRPVQFEITQAAHAGRLAGLDQAGRAEVRRLPVPEPAARLPSSWGPTVRP